MQSDNRAEVCLPSAAMNVILQALTPVGGSE